MQLRELEIERFGVWQNVNLPFNDRGVTVLYGPNEAGKSTLMRFIRGVLYGYALPDERIPAPHLRSSDAGGTLRVSHRGQELQLRRTVQTGTRGRLEINGRAASENDPLLKDLTGHVPEAIFQNIFAIGLHELQQLATLNADEVASHIYALSLGPEGEQILKARSGLSAAEKRLTTSANGEIHSLLGQLRTIDRDLARLGQPSEKYSRLQGQRRDLEAELDSWKRRLSDLQQSLRGQHLMARIHGPWKQEWELRRQLDRLPRAEINREILQRFDALELELSEVGERRDALIAEARQLQEQSEAIQTRPELEQHHCQIRRLFEKSRSMEALQRSLPDRTGEIDPQGREINQLLARLDGRWDRHRLQRAELSPDQWHSLMRSLTEYRRAGLGHRRLLRRYRSRMDHLRKLEQDWKSQTRDLGKQPPADARKTLQRRLKELEELHALQIRREHLQRTLDLIGRDLGPKIIERELPPFFWMVLWFFVLAGVVLCAAGVYAALHGYAGIVAGGPTAWIVGGCFSLLGLSVMGTSWGMKQYFESVDLSSEEMQQQRHSLEQELVRLEQSMDRLGRRESSGTLGIPLPSGSQPPGEPSLEDRMVRIRQKLLRLDQFESLAQKIEKLRSVLSMMRQRLQASQRLHGHARRDWTESLRRLGLTETLKIPVALEQCELLARAKSLLIAEELGYERENVQRRELEVFFSEVRELGEQIDGRGTKVHLPFESLAEWESELRLLEERRRERARLRQSSQEKRREAAQLQDQMQKMRHQRSGLLRKLGVSERTEIATILAAIDERGGLEQKLQEVRKELSRLTATDSDLALVEDDLLQYDETRSGEILTQLKQDIADVESRLRTGYEDLGTIKRELLQIQDDRSLTSLRFEREQVDHALKQSVRELAATRLADGMVDLLRQRIEKERQPRTLQAASALLHQLTCGKYRKIWTPLSEGVLLIDDEMGQPLRMEQLSSGTREQVFLAVRLAMIRDFADRGIELPMVLDDVTVNFDQHRTEAAVQTLVDVAEQGQQILLFTCHLHLAQMFAARGLEPVWLPAQRGESQLQKS